MCECLITDQRARKVAHTYIYIYSIPGSAVDYHNDLWERDDCLGLGQLYGMSIWGGGWGVAGTDNVRAEPGKLLEP